MLIYREYADEFRLWEGTDIDIPAAIDRRKPAIAGRPLAELLEKAAPMLPLTASRHAYHTGPGIGERTANGCRPSGPSSVSGRWPPGGMRT
jgi:hypothetical protein